MIRKIYFSIAFSFMVTLLVGQNKLIIEPFEQLKTNSIDTCQWDYGGSQQDIYGFIVAKSNQFDLFKEFLQYRINEKLIPGNKYKLSISLTNGGEQFLHEKCHCKIGQYGVSNIGLNFTDKPYNISQKLPIFESSQDPVELKLPYFYTNELQVFDIEFSVDKPYQFFTLGLFDRFQEGDLIDEVRNDSIKLDNVARYFLVNLEIHEVDEAGTYKNGGLIEEVQNPLDDKEFSVSSSTGRMLSSISSRELLGSQNIVSVPDKVMINMIKDANNGIYSDSIDMTEDINQRFHELPMKNQNEQVVARDNSNFENPDNNELERNGLNKSFTEDEIRSNPDLILGEDILLNENVAFRENDKTISDSLKVVNSINHVLNDQNLKNSSPKDNNSNHVDLIYDSSLEEDGSGLSKKDKRFLKEGKRRKREKSIVFQNSEYVDGGSKFREKRDRIKEKDTGNRKSRENVDDNKNSSVLKRQKNGVSENSNPQIEVLELNDIQKISFATFLVDVTGSMDDGEEEILKEVFTNQIELVSNTKVNYNIWIFSDDVREIARDADNIDEEIVEEVIKNIRQNPPNKFKEALDRAIGSAREKYDKDQSNLVIICSDFHLDDEVLNFNDPYYNMQYLEEKIDENRDLTFVAFHYKTLKSVPNRKLQSLKSKGLLRYYYTPIDEVQSDMYEIFSHHFVNIERIEFAENFIRLTTLGLGRDPYEQTNVVSNRGKVIVDISNWTVKDEVLHLARAKGIEDHYWISKSDNELFLKKRRNPFEKLKEPTIEFDKDDIVISFK